MSQSPVEETQLGKVYRILSVIIGSGAVLFSIVSLVTADSEPKTASMLFVMACSLAGTSLALYWLGSVINYLASILYELRRCGNRAPAPGPEKTVYAPAPVLPRHGHVPGIDMPATYEIKR